MEDKQLNYDSTEAAEETAVHAKAEHTHVHPCSSLANPRPSSGFCAGIVVRCERQPTCRGRNLLPSRSRPGSVCAGLRGEQLAVRSPGLSVLNFTWEGR
jgi:hypothetical protein